jgi:hypothetical protein
MTPTNDLPRSQRRRFLSDLGTLAAGCGLAAATAPQAGRAADPASPPLPTIALGQHRVTRLVAGWNPIGGHSYLGHHMDQHMREYFTVDRTVQFLLDCERAGINTHQFSMSDTTQTVLQRVREHGSAMQFFGLHAGRDGVQEVVRKTQPFALAHHGGVTDRLFRENQSGQVHDYVKHVHDCGLLAGVSAHNPDCIRRIADEGWEVDFFMCCFYFLTRTFSSDGGSGTPTPQTLQIAYPFYRHDPRIMTDVIRDVPQPCLGFKILGAGRLCSNQNSVRDAFQFAFAHLKPADGVIVGMYPRFFDEIQTNAQYTREFGGSPAAS